MNSWIRALLFPLLIILMLAVFATYPLHLVYAWLYRVMGYSERKERTMFDELMALRDQMREKQTTIDAVYEERARVVAAFTMLAQAVGWRTGLGIHEPFDDPDWDDDWKNVVYVDLPTGQASWHIATKDMKLFNHLEPYPGKWDGHSTSEKYERLEKLAVPLQLKTIFDGGYR